MISLNEMFIFVNKKEPTNMDTLTHVIIGGGIASLSMLDPVIAESGITPFIYASCILGSNAPDLDYLYKIKGKSSYYRNHRGFSHSLPMVLVWTLLISLLFVPLASPVTLLHIAFWTYLSVQFHVISDILNIHGTQALRPFSAKWLSLDAIPLFDFFILALHAGGFAAIGLGEPPGESFLIVYEILGFYFGIRLLVSFSVKKHLNAHFKNAGRIKIIPSMNLWSFHVIIETEEDFILGQYSLGNLVIETILSKSLEMDSSVQVSLQDEKIADFLFSTPFVLPKVVHRKNRIEVRWIDLRFRKKLFFPFMAVFVLNKSLTSGKAYAGWFHSPFQFKKKVNQLNNDL
ncbi:metal-dependent hydrolase [Rossellomorea vietnamensis]|uniref:Metal-dependent hydrolase n=2 Tax=Rossellomorea vietnamensis TaxID=218284 RepID=A0A5D4NYF7_9BACI|nr:metal-dependent hydrolase [Rossellomorea vietnamensis]